MGWSLELSGDLFVLLDLSDSLLVPSDDLLDLLGDPCDLFDGLLVTTLMICLVRFFQWTG